jgi:hypothetical protein
MNSFIDSLYYGNLLPEEEVVPKDPQYRQLSRELSDVVLTWRQKLSSEDFTELEALIDLQQKIQGMEMSAAFSYGFKLGAGFLIEVLVGNEPTGG